MKINTDKKSIDFDWKYFRMVKDDDTAYDEVAKEIRDIGMHFIENKRAKKLFFAKIKQLGRILNDNFDY